MKERILKYFKVNINDCPIYLEVRRVCAERYLCFFSTLYSKDEFFTEDQYDSFGFKVSNEGSSQRFQVYGKLTPEIARTIWQQISCRLHQPDREINL